MSDSFTLALAGLIIFVLAGLRGGSLPVGYPARKLTAGPCSRRSLTERAILTAGLLYALRPKGYIPFTVRVS